MTQNPYQSPREVGTPSPKFPWMRAIGIVLYGLLFSFIGLILVAFVLAMFDLSRWTFH